MRLAMLLAGAALALNAAPASAGTICEWYAFADRALPQPGPAQPGLTRVDTGEGRHGQAKVALAMVEAVNAIDRRFHSYVDLAVGDRAADQHAAAITAAQLLLLAQPSVNKRDVNHNADLALASITDNSAKAAGIAIGQAAAEAVLRSSDPTAERTLPPYRPMTGPGQWVPTGMPFGEAQMRAMRAWILKSSDEVRAAPFWAGYIVGSAMRPVKSSGGGLPG